MPETWQQRIETIAANLLSLEVNTVVKNGMVAQKMPEVPIGLHVIAETYAGYLQDRRHPVTDYLVRAAAGRLINLDGQADDFRRLMENWPFADAEPRGWTPPNWPADWPARELPLGELSNGTEAFEALQWAAFGAARTAADVRERALFGRIRSNSRQLKEVATVLERQFSSGVQPGLQASTESYDDRLRSIALGQDREQQIQRSRLFGATLEQTARALFQYPRPLLSIDPDLTVLVRKVWDIGLEEVLFQTVIQLDGDVLVRVSDIADQGERAFLAELHRRAVDDGTSQWRQLFRIAGQLIGDVGRLIFGAKSA